MRPSPTYSLDPDTLAFSIEAYNWASPFSNFLPGVAGELGIPIWAYWVNRGQAISGVGVGDRDGQILEFYSFNKACLRVQSEGFRTFIRFDDGTVYEPFRRTADPAVQQSLSMTPADLSLVDENTALGLRTEVSYATLPNRRVGGLVRTVRLTNTGDEPISIDWLDGVPRLLPRGLTQHGIKTSPRHTEAMMGVVDHDGVPLFRLRQSADDDAQVTGIGGGHFYAVEPQSPVVVDATAVFDDHFDVSVPGVFAAGGSDAVLEAAQVTAGRTPCAFTVRSDTIEPGSSVTLTAVVGAVDDTRHLDALVTEMKQWDLDAITAENHDAVLSIADHAFTLSASPMFDAYSRQNLLDNVLRGGLPITIPSQPPRTMHLFWRQNADLERDYHQFDLQPTYLSQGMAHYRNALQNRRNDARFHPEAAAEAIADFIGLIQLDGYNPLEVRHRAYRLDPETVDAVVTSHVDESQWSGVRTALTSGPLAPGSILMLLDDAGVNIRAGWADLLGQLLTGAEPVEIGGLEAGFWIDHWHYNLDLIESHLTVFPDQLRTLLVEPVHTFFDNPDVVLPRAARIVSHDGTVRQHGSVATDDEKAELIANRGSPAHRARVSHGHGDPITVSLLTKLLLLAATRLATIDPGGRGIEMDAGKPGWNDSLNGLPGLFGSGVSELIETRRLVRLLGEWLDSLSPDDWPLSIYAELAHFIGEVTVLLTDADDLSPLEYWDRVNTLKEAYRESIRLGIDGDHTVLTRLDVDDLLTRALGFLDAILAGRNGPILESGVPHTYFINEPTEWDTEGAAIHPRAFASRPLGVFLEGAVHWMREFPESAADVYAAVKGSPLYDEQLGMYKVSGPVGLEDAEAGRAVGAYPPGWLENESIYTHMSYKYLLEVLRSGLCDEFWDDARTGLIPFMDPAVYGRSPFEGVSFIVSSAHPDPREHGRGYQPRLSGVTAEFVHLWLIALAGPIPFRLDDDGALTFAIEPRLPGWMFTDRPLTRRATMPDGRAAEVSVPAGAVAYRLHGTTLVTLLNPDRRPTYGANGARPVAYELTYADGSQATVKGSTVPSPHAEAIRDREITAITVTLA